MKEYEERCAVCGDVLSKYWMERIGTGKNTHWLCLKCFKAGARQADCATHRPGRPARRKTEGRDE